MKNFNTKLIYVLAVTGIILSQLGCAGIGVMETSDPARKIEDAQALMKLDRATLAKRLVHEALEIYTRDGNDVGAAFAHFNLGDINRDGKIKGFPNYEEAKQHYQKAADIYEKLKSPKWQALAIYSVANVQNIEGETKASCDTLKRSKQIYSKSPKANEATETFEKMGMFLLSYYPRIEETFGCKAK